MKKFILAALPLFVSSVASAYYYPSYGYGPGYESLGSEEVHIKFTTTNNSGDRHCLYVSTLAVNENEKTICSDENIFKLAVDVQKGQSKQTLIKVKNEDTNSYVVNGSLYFNVYANGVMETSLAKGIDDLSITQTENNYFEFSLNLPESEPDNELPQIDPETSLIVYSEEHFQGDFLAITESMADLGNFALNIDSYQLPEGWSIRFFEGKNFSGNFYSRGVNPNGVFIPDASDFSPRVQSVQILNKN